MRPQGFSTPAPGSDRKSTRLNSSHTVIYTLSLHDALPIFGTRAIDGHLTNVNWGILSTPVIDEAAGLLYACTWIRSEEHTSELQSHSDLHSFPTRRSSDLRDACHRRPPDQRQLGHSLDPRDR